MMAIIINTGCTEPALSVLSCAYVEYKYPLGVYLPLTSKIKVLHTDFEATVEGLTQRLGAAAS